MRGENTKESERGDKSQVWAAARTELCATLIDLIVLKQQQHFQARPVVQQQSRDRSTPGEPRGAGKVTTNDRGDIPAQPVCSCHLWLSKTVALSRPPLNDLIYFTNNLTSFTTSYSDHHTV